MRLLTATRAVTGMALAILVAGTLAWVFPREATGFVGPWCLPALSVASVFLALLMVIEWPLLRVLVMALVVPLVLGWNQVSPTSTSHFAGTGLGLLTLVTIPNAVTTPARLRAALFVFLAAAVAVLLVGLAGTESRAETFVDPLLPAALSHVPLGLAGLEGGVVNPNALAAVALLVTPLGFAVLAIGTSERTDRYCLVPLSVLLVVTSALSLLVSNSRTAWVALWLLAVGFLVRGPRRQGTRVLLGMLVVGPLVLAWTAAVLLDRDGFLLTAGDVWQSVQDRAYIMGQGAEKLREAPWFGIGLNEYRTVHVPLPSAAAHAHNIFLQTALDVGIVGSVAYWGLLIFLLARANEAAQTAFNLGRIAAVGSALALVAVTLFGLTDAVVLGAKVGLFQWQAAGLILAAWRLRAVETP